MHVDPFSFCLTSGGTCSHSISFGLVHCSGSVSLLSCPVNDSCHSFCAPSEPSGLKLTIAGSATEGGGVLTLLPAMPGHVAVPSHRCESIPGDRKTTPTLEDFLSHCQKGSNKALNFTNICIFYAVEPFHSI